jgi:FKBP-type peptidyl-prolyl cis-trans isomerase
MRIRRYLPVIAAFLFGACNLDVPNPANDPPSDPATETFEPKLGIDISKMQKTAAGTYYKDLVVGTGATLTGNTVIVMSYLGMLKNAAAFASEIKQTVALGSLVGGLQDAMPGMKVGGERLIVVPSRLGFGAAAVGSVPPNSTLVFDVKLEGIP